MKFKLRLPRRRREPRPPLVTPPLLIGVSARIHHPSDHFQKLGGVYTNDSGEYSGCAPFDPCTMLKLHVIDATGASPDLTIPIHGNFWNLSWQRVAP